MHKYGYKFYYEIVSFTIIEVIQWKATCSLCTGDQVGRVSTCIMKNNKNCRIINVINSRIIWSICS